MRDDDEWRPAAGPTTHAVGSDLSTISVDELRARIELLRVEINRIEAEIGRKEASREAASAAFRL